MMKSVYLLIIFFLLSCGQIEFIYENKSNLKNPIYQKTQVFFTGKDIASLYKYSSIYFVGDGDDLYELNININEEKTRRSVQTNQAIEKLDYKLTFDYNLFNKNIDCIVYKKTIESRFTFEPKSSGYNFGSDQSLKKLYDSSVNNNFQNFINDLVNIDLESCSNEN